MRLTFQIVTLATFRCFTDVYTPPTTRTCVDDAVALPTSDQCAVRLWLGTCFCCLSSFTFAIRIFFKHLVEMPPIACHLNGCALYSTVYRLGIMVCAACVALTRLMEAVVRVIGSALYNPRQVSQPYPDRFPCLEFTHVSIAPPAAYFLCVVYMTPRSARRVVLFSFFSGYLHLLIS